MNSIFATAMMIRSHEMICGRSGKAYPLSIALEEIGDPVKWEFDFSTDV